MMHELAVDAIAPLRAAHLFSIVFAARVSLVLHRQEVRDSIIVDADMGRWTVPSQQAA